MIAYLSNYAQQLLECLWLNIHIPVTAYNWWCNHHRLIFENKPNLNRNKFFPLSKMAAMVVLWSCDLMAMWPVWSNGNIEGKTCRIGDDKSGYFAFHCGSNFKTGCNANTTLSGKIVNALWARLLCLQRDQCTPVCHTLRVVIRQQWELNPGPSALTCLR